MKVLISLNASQKRIDEAISKVQDMLDRGVLGLDTRQGWKVLTWKYQGKPQNSVIFLTDSTRKKYTNWKQGLEAWITDKRPRAITVYTDMPRELIDFIRSVK